MHRRVLVPTDSYYMNDCVSKTEDGCVARDSRSVGVCRGAWLAGDEPSGLCLDLVEREVDRGKVRSRKMGVESPGRVEEGRKVRSYVG